MHPTPTLEVSSPLDCRIQIRSHRIVHLGPLRLEIRSNEPEFRGFRFFSQFSQCSDPTACDAPQTDFTLTLCNLKTDAPWPIEQLAREHDASYRAKRMAAGYYLTDHFGAPAYLLTRGRHYWILAEDFEPILWPYAVKYLLSLYSMQHNYLHLKAAGVALDGQAVLLVGRGGSGKTVLLSHLCRAGARFVTNTHALIDDRHTLLGVQTALRVRADRFFAPLISARGLAPSVREAEYTADPVHDFGWSSTPSAPISAVCLLDYQPGRNRIEEIDRDILFDYMEQFSLAVNVYGLKEDLLDALSGEVMRFSTEMSQMRTRLRALLAASRCYYVSCDAADLANFRALWALLQPVNHTAVTCGRP